jgi:flagellar motility protein MotE (MotC chaperone)
MKRKMIMILVIAGIAGYTMAGSGLFNFPYALALEQQLGDRKIEGQTPADKIRLEMANDLLKKQEELDKRDELLKSKEGQLRVVEQDIDKKIDELKRVQQKLEELVKVRDDMEAKNLANLTKAYSSMAPPDAASRLKAMDRGIALKILMAMKTKNSSKILSSLDTATAAQLSEQLAKRQME